MCDKAIHAPTRRRMLAQSALGFGGLALQAMLAEETRAAESPRSTRVDPLSPKPTHFAPRAKRIVFLFMKGGPSHIDTFDYKPLLQRDHGKPYPFAKPRVQFTETGALFRSPWEFRQHGESGGYVSSLFPRVAKHADDLCVIHSLHGTNPAHGGACMKLHTGSDTFVRPSMGAWITYGLGSENANLPGFITICPTLAHGGVINWSSAFLPAPYQGTPLGNASVPSEQARVKNLSNATLSPRQQRLQLDLLREMNLTYQAETGPDAGLEGRIASFELAFRMQTAMPEIQSLADETSATLESYGLNRKETADFGRQCLLARRFLERGVRFVQVSHSDTKVQWDQHGDLLRGHQEKALEVDQPIAAFLADLKARGMLEDTLVLWGGEIGRTPTMQGADGRDHNPEGFTMWLAGGGARGGLRYGATDDYGYFAVENKVHIHDLHATLLHLLGLDHERLTYRYAGRDFRLTDVAGRVVKDLFA